MKGGYLPALSVHGTKESGDPDSEAGQSIRCAPAWEADVSAHSDWS